MANHAWCTAVNDLFPGDSAQDKPTAANIAKRFSALALRVAPSLAQQSVAIGGGADMDDRAAMDDGDVNDPKSDISFIS